MCLSYVEETIVDSQSERNGKYFKKLCAQCCVSRAECAGSYWGQMVDPDHQHSCRAGEDAVQRDPARHWGYITEDADDDLAYAGGGWINIAEGVCGDPAEGGIWVDGDGR